MSYNFLPHDWQVQIVTSKSDLDVDNHLLKNDAYDKLGTLVSTKIHRPELF